MSDGSRLDAVLTASRPSAPPEVSSALDDAYGEYCRQREAGTPPDADEFCRRFPGFQASLRRLIDAHAFLEENEEILEKRLQVRWPEAGSTFLGFEIHRELGRGAFGRVFLATEAALGGRRVALKVSLRGAAEAKKIGPLRHPNVIPVYSVIEDDDSRLTAICMPYLGSATLNRVLDLAFARPGIPASARVILDAACDPDVGDTERSHPLRVLRAGTYVDGVLHLGLKLAEALAFIHARGVCHRDLKPSNVLLTPAGTPLLLDFNLSQDLANAEQWHGGTLAYMAPEQLHALDVGDELEAGRSDPRADLFAFGVILFELLTGQHPFGPIEAHPTPRKALTHLIDRQSRGPADLLALNPNVDHFVAELVVDCLAPEASGRPQSASAVVTRLRQALSPVRRARRRVRRHPFFVSLVVALLFAVNGAGLWWWVTLPPYAVREARLGQRAYAAGDFAAAVSHFSRAAERETEAGQALFGSARARQQLGERDARFFSLALDDYRQSDALAPSGKAKAGMGYCLSRMRQPQVAIEEYKRAIKAGYAPAAVFNNLGYTLFLAKKLPDAERFLDRAAELEPDLPAARHNRAELRLQQMLGLAAKLFPAKGPCNFPPAKCEAMRQDFARYASQAQGDVARAVQHAPDDRDLLVTAARVHSLALAPGGQDPGPALALVAKAVRHGHPPQALLADHAFFPIRHLAEFNAIAAENVPPVSAHHTSSRLVDPIRDEPF